MVAAKTSDDLLTEVRELAQIADADPRVPTAGILRFASRRLSTTIADLLVSTRQERWVTTHTDVSIVSGTARYRVPSRALAAGVADIIIASGDDEWDAPYLEADERPYYHDQSGPWSSPYAYTWEGDHVVLLPTPSESSYSLRIRYPRQPSRLVETSACARVSSIAGTVITTAATVPSAWGSSETLDLVEGTPHGDTLGADLAGTSISGTSITIASGLPSEAASGDYVCLAGESCVIPVPESVWPALVSSVALDASRALGDTENVAHMRDQATSDLLAVRNILSPRSRGARQIVRRRHSPLHGGRFPGWGVR